MLIDGGDTGEGSHPLRAWKTPILWDAMTAMGYDVFALGERDIADTTLIWLQKHKRKHPYFVTGNLMRKNSSMHLQKPYVVIKKGKAKIGIVAAMDTRMQSRLQGLSLTPVPDILNEAQKYFARKNADFRILVYHGLISDAQRLAQERTDFDLILLGHSIGRPMASRIQPNQVPVVGPGDRGRELAWVTLKKPVTTQPEDKVQCTIIPLDDRVAASPRAIPFMRKAKQVGKKIYSRRRTSRKRR